VAICVFITCIYLIATEYIPLEGSKGEILIFPSKPLTTRKMATDEENFIVHDIKDTKSMIRNPVELAPELDNKNVPFVWRNLCYDIQVKGGPKRLLNDISGLIKPGTLTAIMVSRFIFSFCCSFSKS
jgi:ATP-binding cassette, subfamily G (WHITE), member 2, PDR